MITTSQGYLAVASHSVSKGSAFLPLGGALRRAVHGWDAAAVRLADSLGEGPGRWHQGPRARDDETNCLNFVFQVLGRAYSCTSGLPESFVLAALRYHEPGAYFGLRKHFVEQWLATSPGPFRAIRLGAEVARTCSLTLDPRRLANNAGYDGPLLLEDHRNVELTYYEPAAVLAGLERLPPQFLAVFGVPTATNLDRVRDAVGPLGITHCLLVELHPRRRPTAHHASTAAGRVLHEPFETFIGRSAGAYAGFLVHGFDSGWRPGFGGWTTTGRLIATHERSMSPNQTRGTSGAETGTWPAALGSAAR